VSGGAYNYLCFADGLDGLAERREDLESMADRLARLPWATGAAAETAELVSRLREIDALSENLSDLRQVWRAIEWWDSGDYGEAQAPGPVDIYVAERGG
jgi:hypothetical protein